MHASGIIESAGKRPSRRGASVAFDTWYRIFPVISVAMEKEEYVCGFPSFPKRFPSNKLYHLKFSAVNLGLWRQNDKRPWARRIMHLNISGIFCSRSLPSEGFSRLVLLVCLPSSFPGSLFFPSPGNEAGSRHPLSSSPTSVNRV